MKIYDLYSQSFKSNAYETFAKMRSRDPVHKQPGLDGETMIWFVTRYDLVAAILRDDKRFVRDYHLAMNESELSALPSQPPITSLIENHMLNKDGDDHRRLRGLVSKAFTPKMVTMQRDRIRDIANALLDDIQADGRADLVESYAFPLPIIVIAELLGVPAADRNKFRLWSDAVVTPDFSPGSQQRFISLMQDFIGYLRQLFEERRRQPLDDLVSGLVKAEESGDRLSEEELFSTVILLIIAGHETTVSLIGNASLSLLQNPQLMQLLKNDPSQTPAAIEEIIRYDGPVERALNRWAAEDVEIGGHLIKRGEIVIPILGAADRDPAQFEEPDNLNIRRGTNTHLGFGRGSHYCLGAPLARLEGEIAINTMLERLPNLRLEVNLDKLEWRLVPLFHALTSLPVAWDA